MQWKHFSSSGILIYLLTLNIEIYLVSPESGLFTTYMTIKFTKGKYEKFNTIGFIIYRILRLIPQLAIFILFTILLPKLGSGPIWKTHMGPIVENCRKNWWHNLLFLQTFLSIETKEKQLNIV